MGCFFPDPNFLSIPNPGSKYSNIRGEGTIRCLNFFCSHKFAKTENYFIFEQEQNKIRANWQRTGIEVLFTPKNMRNIGWGSGKKPIPDPGSGSATLVYRPCALWLDADHQAWWWEAFWSCIFRPWDSERSSGSRWFCWSWTESSIYHVDENCAISLILIIN